MLEEVFEERETIFEFDEVVLSHFPQLCKFFWEVYHRVLHPTHFAHFLHGPHEFFDENVLGVREKTEPEDLSVATFQVGADLCCLVDFGQVFQVDRFQFVNKS